MSVYSIDERVAIAVETRLKGVRRAAGFNTDLRVNRFKMGQDESIADYDAAIYEGDDTFQSDTAQGYFTYDKQFAVVFWVRESRESGTPPDQRINTIRADIVKAIMQDPQFGGLALDTFMQGFRRADPDHGIYGGLIEFDVRYRVREDDPYSQ